MYTNGSLRDLKYKVDTRPRSWQRPEYIKYRTNAFLEVSAKFCSRNNVYGHPTAVVDVRKFYEEENRILDHQLDTR